MTRPDESPFTERHPLVSLAFLVAVLLVLAVVVGTSVGGLGALAAGALSTS